MPSLVVIAGSVSLFVPTGASALRVGRYQILIIFLIASGTALGTVRRPCSARRRSAPTAVPLDEHE
jgi:ABC-type iron transport system FetAB permease component